VIITWQVAGSTLQQVKIFDSAHGSCDTVHCSAVEMLISDVVHMCTIFRYSFGDVGNYILSLFFLCMKAYTVYTCIDEHIVHSVYATVHSIIYLLIHTRQHKSRTLLYMTKNCVIFVV